MASKIEAAGGTLFIAPEDAIVWLSCGRSPRTRPTRVG
jgi:hypothetical protein